MKRYHSAGYIWGSGGNLEHIEIAERALGRQLPAGAEVHHIDSRRDNNARTNLVICPNHAYHALLHVREKALNACGDPDKRKCIYCKKWDIPSTMSIHDKGNKGIEYRHRPCHASNQRARNKSRRNGVK